MDIRPTGVYVASRRCDLNRAETLALCWLMPKSRQPSRVDTESHVDWFSHCLFCDVQHCAQTLHRCFGERRGADIASPSPARARRGSLGQFIDLAVAASHPVDFARQRTASSDLHAAATAGAKGSGKVAGAEREETRRRFFVERLAAAVSEIFFE